MRLRGRSRTTREPAGWVPVGVRESGDPLLLPGPSGDALHLLLGGMSGAGKTATVRAFTCEVAGRDDVAIVGLDPKRTGLAPWSPRATVIAKGHAECTSVFVLLWELARHRHCLMEAAGVDEWHPDLGGPFLFVPVDELAEVVSVDGARLAGLLAEVQDLAATNQIKDHSARMNVMLQSAKRNREAQGVFITSVARTCRSAGIQLVCATQHPTTDIIDSQLRSNLTVRVCLRVATRDAVSVVLGQGAEGDVTPSSIAEDERGGLWVGGLEGRPIRGRSYWVTPAEGAARAADTAHLRWPAETVFAGLEMPAWILDDRVSDDGVSETVPPPANPGLAMDLPGVSLIGANR